MFIIEGSDNLGKTVAAKKAVEMANVLGVPAWYSHMGRPGKAWDFSPKLYADRISRYAVQDRFHLGALVWHKGVLNEPTLRVIEEHLWNADSFTLIIYHGDDGEYRRRLEQSLRKELFDVEELVAANRKYRDMVFSEHSPLVVYDSAWDAGSGFIPDDVLFNMIETWSKRFR